LFNSLKRLTVHNLTVKASVRPNWTQFPHPGKCYKELTSN
jgi:hypothetical protein